MAALPPASNLGMASLPTPADSRAATPTPKRIVWMPTRIHPTARVLADELFDVITPEDPRAAIWPDLAVGAIVRTGQVTEEEIKRAKYLQIITRNGVGVDMIPIALCKSLGIPVTNQPGSNARAVAELVLGLSLAVLRRMVELDRRLRRGEHLPNIDWLAETLDDKVVGLVGMGAIAREAAKKFYGAYDSPILVYSPTSEPRKWTSEDPSGLPPIPHTRVNSLEELLSTADVVSLHCPLTEETRNMISTPQLKLMKKTAVLLNTARGGLIDEPALIRALKNNEIYGAGLDVLCTEPATPEIYSELYALENVVVLPHAGGGTDKVQIDSCRIAVETCDLFLRGEGIGKSTRVV